MHAVLSFLAWVQGAGTVGALLFALLYALATVLFFPGSVLTLVAGFLYGLAGGLAVVLPGSLLGAALSFLLGRTVLRQRIARAMQRHPRFQAVEQAISEDAFRVVLLLRLSPLFPFNLLNYGLGVTRVPLGRYLLASLLGMFPGTLLYVYLGTLGTSAAELLSGRRPASGRAGTLLLFAGLLATGVLVVLLSRAARRLLNARLAPAAPSRP